MKKHFFPSKENIVYCSEQLKTSIEIYGLSKSSKKRLFKKGHKNPNNSLSAEERIDMGFIQHFFFCTEWVF